MCGRYDRYSFVKMSLLKIYLQISKPLKIVEKKNNYTKTAKKTNKKKVINDLEDINEWLSILTIPKPATFFLPIKWLVIT